jgi:hypothetical protein
MSVIFKAKNHKYESIDPEEQIDWISVTSFISLFKPKFDPTSQALKSSKNKKSKWFGLSMEEIQEAWENEGKRAVDLGTWYHDQREKDLTDHMTIDRLGVSIPIIKPLYEGDIKQAPNQKLTEGIYPEHFVYLKSAGICGQSDRVEVVKDTVDIYDYKTNKEIKLQGFKNYQGVVSKMYSCCSHLDDCNFNHYALQLSVYMYIILKHNPRYKPGKMQLHHIVFETEGLDQYGYPIAKLDLNNNPIVKEVVPYDVPYLKREVIDMINWLYDNRDKIKNEKEKDKN